MKIVRILFIYLLLVAVSPNVRAQSNAGPPKKDQSIKSKRKQRKEDKRKWKEERKKKRDEEKMIRDHHKRIQTKEVRKRMKRSKNLAQRNHDHTREPWYQRIFNKPGKGKRSKAPKEKTQKVKQN